MCLSADFSCVGVSKRVVAYGYLSLYGSIEIEHNDPFQSQTIIPKKRIYLLAVASQDTQKSF